MAIKLFDSLTREMRELRPAEADGVFRFYNCGPTVYAPAHIGNFRTFVINDVLRRLLELEFPGKVKHVRNLTDVDDRTIGQARAEGRPLGEITRKWTELFHADCAALNCLPPARRADGDRPHPRAGRHDRRPHEQGERLPRARRLGVLQDRLVPAVRRPLPDQGARAQGHEQRLRRRPQGRRRRLRPLEGLQARGGRRRAAGRARRAPPRAARAGTSSAAR